MLLISVFSLGVIFFSVNAVSARMMHQVAAEEGIISASRNYLTTGFNYWRYFNTPGIAPAGWFIFGELGLNPFN